MMLKKAEIQELKPGDKVIYYGEDDEPQYATGIKGVVKEVYDELQGINNVALIDLEDINYKLINNAHYFDLIVESNDLQQRKRSQMNNIPSHYAGTDGVDVIEFCRQQFTHEELVGALKFNIIKYATRLGRKDNDIEDNKKIGVYQRRLQEVLADE